jgi:parallel beta-helix repeat protein
VKLTLVAAIFALLLAPPVSAQGVSCGQVIVADTRLDRDLVDCPADGLVIGADGVRLDLDGHTIDGDGRDVGSPADDGVDNSAGYDDVEIIDGRIQQFEVGVRLGDFPGAGAPAGANEARGLTLVDNDNGVLLVESQGSRVAHNRIDQTTGGIGVSLVNRGSDNLIVRNSITRAGVGIEVTGAVAENRVLANMLFGNCVGIGLQFANATEVRRNRTVDNNCPGIQLAGANENAVKANVVSGNGEVGVRLFGSSDNVFARNRVTRTVGIGEPEGADGFWLDDLSEGNLLRGNIARLNPDDGIDVEGAGNELARNDAIRNGDLGIEAAPGTIDGGGNRAKRNGNPLQCTGVSCR